MNQHFFMKKKYLTPRPKATKEKGAKNIWRIAARGCNFCRAETHPALGAKLKADG
jgi:hypothetical protein